MTTEQIRRLIRVTDFAINAQGVQINYLMGFEIELIEYNAYQACMKMEEYGIIEAWSDDGSDLLLLSDGVWYTWSEYVDGVGMWQYAALLLAINEELDRANRRYSPFDMAAGIVRDQVATQYFNL